MTTQSLPLHHLGALPTPAMALGCMAMSHMYGPSDRDDAIATIHAALDAGITLLDTGDFYGMGHNELLIAEALSGHDRDDVQVSVKFGAQCDHGGAWVGFDASPAAVVTALAYTLNRLGTDHVDIYRPARLDPTVPIEETVGAIAAEVQAGRVRHIGLSEVGADTIRRAHAVHPIADVQIEWSLITRTVEGEILDTCRELGIGMTAYGVLSRGLLSGHWTPDRDLGASDFRAHSPRFQGENLAANLRLVEGLREVATSLDATVAQVAIAWVMAQGEDVVPVVGARTSERLGESLGAAAITLDDAALARIEAAVPAEAVQGARYPDSQMASLDSER